VKRGFNTSCYWGVEEGEGEVASAPLLADGLVSADPLVSPDALVSAGVPAPELGCARMDLILCIASNLRCLTARSSSILWALLALSCELSGGAKPGGTVAEGGLFEEASFLKPRN
jgi:hypothetical protein